MEETQDRSTKEAAVGGDCSADLFCSQLEKHILAKILGGQDFPATSAAVSAISKLTSGEDSSVAELTNIILKDYGLTSKLLKIVNTVNYARFGEVTTVSRALILLGTESIKNLAISMSLFQLVGKRPKPGLAHLLAKAVYAGVLGQKVAEKVGKVNPEEAFICTLFHYFGEILSAYYDPEKHGEISEKRKEAKEKGLDDEEEAFRSLYERIGVSISSEWGFPDQVVRCMKKLLPGDMAAKGDTAWLHCICVLSNRLAEIPKEAKDRKEQVREALTMFGGRFDKVRDVADVLNTPKEELQEYCAAYGVNVEKFLDEEVAPSRNTWKRDIEDMMASMRLDMTFKMNENVMTPEVIFARGLQDITNTIIDNRYGSVNDIMRVIMETMYRGLSHAAAAKVAFLIKSTQGNTLEIRSIIGDSLAEVKQWINIPLAVESSDIFNLAIKERKDLVVGNISQYKKEHILPSCFRDRMGDDVYLILLPIVVNDVSIGVFFVEGPAVDFEKITPSQFLQLKILMDQAVLAIRRRASGPANREDPELKYRNALGLTKNDGPQEIKSKYRQLLSKYHPDKVQHLGGEFHQVAEEKTKQIMEAYQYFEKKLGF